MITIEGTRLKLAGPVSLNTVCGVHREGLPHLARGDWVVDLAGVTTIDSTAVCLLLEWQREARRHRHSIVFANLPENLRALAELYGTLALLSVSH